MEYRSEKWTQEEGREQGTEKEMVDRGREEENGAWETEVKNGV